MGSGWTWDAVSGPAWRWDVTWMEVRHKYQDLDWGELRPGWMWDINLMPGLFKFRHTSIQAAYHLHQSPQIASQFDPVPISMPSRSHLLSSLISLAAEFLSQLYTCIIWLPSKSLDYHLSSIHVASHLDPCTAVFLPPASRLGITSFQLSWCTVLLHPVLISTPARSRCEYQLYPCPLLIYIQVTRSTSHLHSCRVSPQSMSWYLWLTCTQVMSQLHPGPSNCISIRTTSNLKPVQISKCVSPPSRLCLICIRVPRFLFQLLQCTVKPPSRPRKMQINSIKAHTKFVLVSGCWLHLHPCSASPAFRSQNSCLISLHVPAHFYTGPSIPISASSMYSSTSICVTTFVSHSQPCHARHTTRTDFCVSPSSRSRLADM